MSRRFGLLVFDWDGTLMDSVANIIATVGHASRDLNLQCPDEETIRGTIGLGMRETMDVLFPGTGEALRRRVRESYRNHWLATYRDNCVLFDGVKDTVKELARRGYLLAVATGKGRPGLDRDLSHTGLGEAFHTTRTADEAPSKPNPQMLLDILAELGQNRDQALMIGDTTHDLEMARHAGVPAVGVTGGSHPRRWLEQFEPLACLNGVTELPAWLADGDGGLPKRSEPDPG